MKGYKKLRTPYVLSLLLLASCAFYAASWQSNNPPAENKGLFASFQDISANQFRISKDQKKQKKIQVKSSRNIELFGLVMQLDGGASLQTNTDSTVIDGKKTTWRDWYALTWKNYQRYKAFDSSRMMQAYRSYGSKGFSDDFFIGLLLQVDEVPHAKLNATTDNDAILRFSQSGNLEEAKKKATAFLELLNHFYNDVNFAAYLKENKRYYDTIKADVEKNLPPASFVPTMEAFYRKQFTAYYLVPSLNIPTSMGFGKFNKSTKTIYNTFGPFSFQSFDAAHFDLGFDYPDRIQGLSVHEFGHSFVNPAIDNVPKALIDSTSYLYKPIEAEMRKQAYVSWTACLYEHFVRAGEVVIARKQGRMADAEKTLEDNLKKHFIYLPAIVHELEAYDKNQSRYPSYDAAVIAILEKLKADNKQQ